MLGLGPKIVTKVGLASSPVLPVFVDARHFPWNYLHYFLNHEPRSALAHLVTLGALVNPAYSVLEHLAVEWSERRIENTSEQKCDHSTTEMCKHSVNYTGVY